MPRKRSRMRRKNSRKVFTKGAVRVHPKNGLLLAPMRGGIRL